MTLCHPCAPLPLAGRVKAVPYCRFSAHLGGHSEARGASGRDFSFIETGWRLFLPSCAGAGSFGFARVVFLRLEAFPGGTVPLGEEVGVGNCFARGCSEGPGGGFLVGSGEGRPTAP